MSAAISVQLIGGENVIRALERAENRIEKQVINAIAASAFRIQSAARRDSPVDTGRLRSSILVRFFDGGLQANVESDVFYAPYQEFGTEFIEARLFLTNAFNDEVVDLRERIRSIIRG